MDRPELIVGHKQDWVKYADWLEGENERLRKAGTKFLLNMWKDCGKGSTEFKVETDFVEEFYAALENDVETVTDNDYRPLPTEGRDEKRYEDARMLAQDIRDKTSDADMLALANLRNFIS
jgi:hypothetical protein